MFGNTLPEKEYVENLVMGKLLSINSIYFDFKQCSFMNQAYSKVVEGDRLNWDGCGWAGIFAKT